MHFCINDNNNVYTKQCFSINETNNVYTKRQYFSTTITTRKKLPSKRELNVKNKQLRTCVRTRTRVQMFNLIQAKNGNKL